MTVLNDGGETERSFKEIYPPDLGFKSFPIRLYDKRDDFLFSIVRMNYCSYIHSKIFYSAFRGETLRIARTKSACLKYSTSSKVLLNRVQKNGCNAVVLKILHKYFGRDFEVFQRFNDTFITFKNYLFY